MLLQFPANIALGAIARWTQTDDGGWFPTEKGLRDLCLSMQEARKPAQPAAALTYDRTSSEEERVIMRRKMAGFSLAMKARGGASVEMPTDSITLAEFLDCRARFAKQDAADLAKAQAAGFRTVAKWMGDRR